MEKYEKGDLVIYHKPKISTHPGHRAEGIHPARYGDDYTYMVDKFWMVSRIIDKETIEVKTRTGKTHEVHVDDPHLRKAGVKDKVLHRGKFPDPEEIGVEK
jgi:hypothetical protein